VILADWRERAAGVELEPTNPEWTGNQTRSCFAMNDPKKILPPANGFTAWLKPFKQNLIRPCSFRE
jgi:tRNA(Leu) C34 or U34 (ribose-2'-O)-methylase TrmL